MLSNGDSCGLVANGSITILIKKGNSTNATHHQHRMQQTMHNGDNNS